MIFDSDVCIDAMRGSQIAINAILNTKRESRAIPAQVHMELMQGTRDKVEQRKVRNTLRDLQIEILEISETISKEARMLVEKFALSDNLLAGDALIAATAICIGDTLCTSNAKHFRKVVPNIVVVPKLNQHK